MTNNWTISKGNPYPLGSYVEHIDGCQSEEMTINFAMVFHSKEPCGINFYNKKTGKCTHIAFTEKNRTGNIYCIGIKGIDTAVYDYTFVEGEKEFCDPFSKIISGNGVWGKSPTRLRSGIMIEKAHTDACESPFIKYSDSIFYLLHVRGFTKSKSSGVSAPGTFKGIEEKIPYLKGLGVTGIILMPAYEFIELEAALAKPEGNVVAEHSINPYQNSEPKLNAWGYKSGYYFAPKRSYSEANVEPSESFRSLVEALHKEKMELIMQFYFDKDVKKAMIPEILKFWVREYNVDGFQLCGEAIPMDLLGTEPMLTNTKLISDYIRADEIYGNSKPIFKNLAVCNDEYMYNVRRFIKSDEGQLQALLNSLKWNDDRLAGIHYITTYYGFTLMDLVSYDRKHNECNGENNQDGNTYNASWNCGCEGPTSRKAVKRLRQKQIRNAILINMLSQSSPMIRSGDEMGHSQKGNNNPYCIDNGTTWIDWKELDRNSNIYQFYMKAVEFRKANRIISMDKVYRMSDYCSLGYPDLSYHSEEAWKLDNDYLSRDFAMLYACDYGNIDEKTGSIQDKTYGLIYVAMNMHWNHHVFALPRIRGGRSWSLVFDTSCEEAADTVAIPWQDEGDSIIVKERSIVVLQCR